MSSNPVAQKPKNPPGKRVSIFFMAVCFTMSFVVEPAEPGGQMISLNPEGIELNTFRVARDAEVKLSNDSGMTLHDFTIIQIASGKKMMFIPHLEPRASMNLAFGRVGTYVACYSRNTSIHWNQSTCLQIDVVGLRSA